MKYQKSDLEQLLDRYWLGTASSGEVVLVEAYLDQLEKGPVKQRSPEEEEAIRCLILARIRLDLGQNKGVLIRMNNRWKMAAAVVALVICLSVAWFLVQKRSLRNRSEQPGIVIRDVKAPMQNHATVTLADGKTVFLDSAGNGQLALQGNTRLVKLADGRIAYESPASATGEVTLNTLTNPRGSKLIDMLLSDGSRVWLNSGSSVTFPVAFTGSERKVMVDGEAYFEVSHDPSRPFIVTDRNSGWGVEVLGTHFNVNAYSDEKDVKITLLEGSVKVTSGRSSRFIRPGQQARIDETISVGDVDVDEVMSWKQGLFMLDNTDVATLFRQISRWYNVDVVYERKVPDLKFGGGISKEQPLSRIMETLERYGLHFELIGNTMIVK